MNFFKQLQDLALEVLDNLWLNLKITKSSKATKDDHFDADEEVASIDGVVDVLMEVTKLFGDRYNLFEQAMEKVSPELLNQNKLVANLILQDCQQTPKISPIANIKSLQTRSCSFDRKNRQ